MRIVLWLLLYALIVLLIQIPMRTILASAREEGTIYPYFIGAIVGFTLLIPITAMAAIGIERVVITIIRRWHRSREQKPF